MVFLLNTGRKEGMGKKKGANNCLVVSLVCAPGPLCMNMWGGYYYPPFEQKEKDDGN